MAVVELLITALNAWQTNNSNAFSREINFKKTLWFQSTHTHICCFLVYDDVNLTILGAGVGVWWAVMMCYIRFYNLKQQQSVRIELRFACLRILAGIRQIPSYLYMMKICYHIHWGDWYWCGLSEIIVILTGVDSWYQSRLIKQTDIVNRRHWFQIITHVKDSL